MSERPPGPRRAPGQVLVAVYAVFALSAGARSGVQLATRFDRAPEAYVLSALAALVYLVATVALRIRGRTAYLVAVTACTVELAGVTGIGAWTTARPELFADATVWSHFGAGYGYVPLVLPVLGLAWLWHVRRTDPAVARVRSGG